MRSIINDAIKFKLYTDTESIFYHLLTERNDLIKEIVMIDDCSLGMIFKYPEDLDLEGDHIGVYVLPEKRRQGYGTKIIEKLGGIQDRNWLIGEEGSGEFWTCLN